MGDIFETMPFFKTFKIEVFYKLNVVKIVYTNYLYCKSNCSFHGIQHTLKDTAFRDTNQNSFNLRNTKLFYDLLGKLLT